MLLTLALVVFFGSIAVFFSQEFVKGFKKVFAIKGVTLFLPLLIASWLIYTFDYWVLWVLYYYREILQIILGFLLYIMPLFKATLPIALVILLTVIAVVPVVLIDLFVRRKTYKGYQYPYITSTVIWIISAILLLAF